MSKKNTNVARLERARLRAAGAVNTFVAAAQDLEEAAQAQEELAADIQEELDHLAQVRLEAQDEATRARGRASRIRELVQ